MPPTHKQVAFFLVCLWINLIQPCYEKHFEHLRHLLFYRLTSLPELFVIHSTLSYHSGYARIRNFEFQNCSLQDIFESVNRIGNRHKG